MESSRTNTRKVMEVGDKESPKACLLLKSSEPLYTCPRTPFYRQTKRLLHFDIALRSKEYSKWEHVHEYLLHPVIHGANFRYLQAYHLFEDFWYRSFGLAHSQLVPSFATIN
jgi:hypothetical protein